MTRALPQWWTGWACGLLLLAGGLWARLDRLGEPSFDIDEYLHVFAARSLNTAGEPLLPSGKAYDRALPYTRLVALSFRAAGAVNEFTARLPSVVIDLGVFAVIFLMVRGWFGTPAALLATTLLAAAPWWITEAKNCRMYTLLNLIHVTSAWSAWQALEGGGARRWLWAALAVAAVAFGVTIHPLSAALIPAVGAFVLTQALITRRRFYCVLGLTGLIAIGVAAATGAVDLAGLWRQANQAPSWADSSRYDWGYYLRQWWAMYPLFIVLYPIAIIKVWRRQRALGLFLLCAGLVPFGLHSFLFDWKRLRYALYTLPWLMIPSAALLADWLGRLRTGRAAWRRGVVAALVLAALHPWAWQATTTPRHFPAPAWRGYYAWLRPQLQEGDVVLSSMPLATLYYLGRPASYVMNNVHVKKAASGAQRGPDGFYRDYYSGQPMVTTKEELERVVAAHLRGWILIDAERFQGSLTLTNDTHEYLASSMQRVEPEVETGLGRPVVVYRWERGEESEARREGEFIH